MKIAAWGAVTTIVLAAMLSACGGDDGSDDEARAKASDRAASASAAAASASAASASASAAEADARAAQLAAQGECETQTGDLSDAVREIDSRLSIGLSYDEYGNRVGDARVAYDQLPITDIERACLKKVAVKLEAALQKYIDVYNDWGTCIEDFNCDFSQGQPNEKAQAAWLASSTLLDRADNGLSSMAPVP